MMRVGDFAPVQVLPESRSLLRCLDQSASSRAFAAADVWGQRGGSRVAVGLGDSRASECIPSPLTA